MISIARRKLLMLFGVPVLCRLQVERTNYNGLGLSTAIGAGIAASQKTSRWCGLSIGPVEMQTCLRLKRVSPRWSNENHDKAIRRMSVGKSKTCARRH
jgi:hypothetical protein